MVTTSCPELPRRLQHLPFCVLCTLCHGDRLPASLLPSFSLPLSFSFAESASSREGQEAVGDAHIWASILAPQLAMSSRCEIRLAASSTPWPTYLLTSPTYMPLSSLPQLFGLFLTFGGILRAIQIKRSPSAMEKIVPVCLT